MILTTSFNQSNRDVIKKTKQSAFCGNGYYWENYDCHKCSANCYFCNDATHCTKCYDNYYVYNGRCEYCYNPCRSCITPSTCASCVETYFLYKGSCITSCPPGTYSTTLVRGCVDCPDNCQVCSKSDCYSCNPGYKLHKGTCIRSCPEGNL